MNKVNYVNKYFEMYFKVTTDLQIHIDMNFFSYLIGASEVCPFILVTLCIHTHTHTYVYIHTHNHIYTYINIEFAFAMCILVNNTKK